MTDRPKSQHLSPCAAWRRDAAIALMKAWLEHVIASYGQDRDKLAAPCYPTALRFAVDRWGKGTTQRPGVENPQAILEDRAVETGRPPVGRRQTCWQILDITG